MYKVFKFHISALKIQFLSQHLEAELYVIVRPFNRDDLDIRLNVSIDFLSNLMCLFITVRYKSTLQVVINKETHMISHDHMLQAQDTVYIVRPTGPL